MIVEPANHGATDDRGLGILGLCILCEEKDGAILVICCQVFVDIGPDR